MEVPMDPASPLLAADQAAALLNVKPATVYDWAAKGILPHIRILAGTRRPVIRFRRADLERFIEQRTVQGHRDRV